MTVASVAKLTSPGSTRAPPVSRGRSIPTTAPAVSNTGPPASPGSAERASRSVRLSPSRPRTSARLPNVFFVSVGAPSAPPKE